MSLRRAMDGLLQRAFGAVTDDYFDIHFGQRPPHHEFSRARDLDVLVWDESGGRLRPDIDADELQRTVAALQRQTLEHLFPPGSALLAMFVDPRRPEPPPPVAHETEDASCHDWLGPLSEHFFTFAPLTMGSPGLAAWLATRRHAGYYMHLERPILLDLHGNDIRVYSTEPATLTEVERLLAPAVAAARARFAPA